MTERFLKFTLLAGLAASIAWFVFVRRQGASDLELLCWLIWPVMLLHQCEENVFTEPVLGRDYGFLSWVRAQGYDLDAGRAWRLNVLVGWMLAIAAGAIGPRFIYFPLFVATVEAVNGAWHLSVSSLQQRWSPGTLSGLLATVPLCFALVQRSRAEGLVEPGVCLAILLAAAVAHHRFLGSLPRVKDGD